MDVKFADATLAGRPADAAARRAALFRETPREILERWTLGTAWMLKPERIGGVPALARLWLTDLLSSGPALPDPARALDNPPGLCGIAHDLSVSNLIEAYRRGLYPDGHLGPTKWFAPRERCILIPDEIRIEKRVRRTMRGGRYRVTFDRDFEGVIKACAGQRPGRWHVTWITPRIMRAYADLFDAGYAHSAEVWNQDGALVGGLYGVAIGRGYFGESMFSLESNTSKMAQAVLNWHLAKWGYAFNDSKASSPMFLSMGFRVVLLNEFNPLLAAAVQDGGRTGRWEVETDLATVAAWRPDRAVDADHDERTLAEAGE